MHREYHTEHSKALGRQMEHLVFGHGGVPVLVFPTSCSRFYQFEDEGMVGAVADKIARGEVQLFCMDSVDSESWYARNVDGRWRIVRHLQYERYVMEELLPAIQQRNGSAHLVMAGCSFGGFHAMSMALRHPDKVTRVLSMSGAFEIRRFLRGHYDEDSYFVLPMDFLPNLSDPWYLERYRRNTYVLATGEDDPCWSDNERMAAELRSKEVPVRLEVWGDHTGHDWPWWRRMLQAYL